MSIPSRQWTGRLWSDSLTRDGRLVMPGAIRMPVSVPLRMQTEGDDAIGEVIHVMEMSGLGVGVGWTTLEPGVYPVAIRLVDVVTSLADGGGYIVRSAVLQEVALTDRSAWPDAAIMVHQDAA